MPSVLIGPLLIRNQPGPFRTILTEAGFDVIDPAGEDNAVSRDELVKHLPHVDAMVVGAERLTPDLFAIAPKLRVAARTGVGYDMVDLPAARAHGVVVTITPGTNQESVAEQAFALLLSLTRSVVRNHEAIRDGGWDRRMVVPLRGKTLGLIGLGRIGRAVATRAQAFGMRVVAHDVGPVTEFDAQHGIERLGLDALLAASHVVSLHVPVTEETRNLVDARFLSKMRPGSYLLNTARGGLVVEADLRDALVAEHLAGAGLDVFQIEPPEPGNVLLSAPNLVFSPHVGGTDSQSMSDMAEMAARCIVDLHQGRWPAACVVDGSLQNGWKW
ncbi:phosphoglycerate dehydrogenase [Paludisphaera borealis]|uniref:Hydroxypyruvate reductase n=1 Tax=Paludisphaera borealis TaxID=1387353 RepID=A0A1U7CW24_9BACT|nr:phosphoglycerate dehydrogenase [Paludisphaera borealis]APW63098.1 Hydroxypyruvate reductase [Paludisphaera borealis]